MFCRYCGRELIDEAYVCPNCGGLARPLPADENERAQSPTPPSNKRQKFQKLSKTFTKIGMILNGVTFGCLALGLFGYIMLAAMGYYGDGLAALIVLSFYGWFFSIIVSAIAVEIATAGFVFGIIQKDDEDVKKVSTTVFVWSIILLVAAIFSIYWLAIFSASL